MVVVVIVNFIIYIISVSYEANMSNRDWGFLYNAPERFNPGSRALGKQRQAKQTGLFLADFRLGSRHVGLLGCS
jgi:hypothetical protein